MNSTGLPLFFYFLSPFCESPPQKDLETIARRFASFLSKSARGSPATHPAPRQMKEKDFSQIWLKFWQNSKKKCPL